MSKDCPKAALPIEQHGFALHKGAFRDALALRYGWPLSQTPATCACRSKFETDQMLTCKAGDYISLHHNELCDMTAGLLRGGGLQRCLYGTDAAASRRRSTSKIRQYIERSQTGYQGKRILGQQVARGIFLILECSITLPQANRIPQLPLFTNNMRTRNVETTVPGFEKLNMGVLHHWFSLQLVVLAEKAQCFLSGWLA